MRKQSKKSPPDNTTVLSEKQYRALTGMDYTGRDGASRRVEPGDPCEQLPHTSIGWLLEQHHIEEVAVGSGVVAVDNEAVVLNANLEVRQDG